MPYNIHNKGLAHVPYYELHGSFLFLQLNEFIVFLTMQCFFSLFYNKGDTIFIFLYVVRGLDHQVFLEICKYFGFFICPLKVGHIMPWNMSSVLPSVNIWLHTGVAACWISFNFTDIIRLVCPIHDTGNGPCSSLNMCILTQLLIFAFCHSQDHFF